MADVVVPDMGKDVEKATVSYWYYKEGDQVAENSDLVELVTDKATLNVPAPGKGILKKLVAQEGASVKPGDLLGIIEPE